VTMGDAILYDILRQGLWVSVMISMPMLAVALIVGLGIGLVQALTSVQEMTLTFVPKVAAMLAAFWVSMTFMTDMLVGFFQRGVLPLVAAP
jgi:flagellar biosynthetic protein FliQ